MINMTRTKVTLRVSQGGGEYYGLTSVTAPTPKHIRRVEGNILLIDDITVEFDEYFEIMKVKEVEYIDVK